MEIEEEKSHPKHLLSDEMKWAIIFWKKEGLSNKAVAKKVGFDHNRPSLSHQTVKNTWNKYQETNQVDNNWSTQGAPRILTMEEEKEVVDLARENRKASSNELLRILEYPVTSRTISNVLVRNGYHAYRAPKKILLTETNISKRREFAVDHSDWTNERWRRIVFSDESSFSIVNPNGRIYVRRQSHEMLEEDTIQHCSSFSKSILIWGAVSFNGVGPLVRIEGNLTAKRYLKILGYRLWRFFPGLKGGNLIWQEDNARPHKAKVVKDWFTKYDIEVINWPPQSPDLNIIEDLWNMIKYKLRGRDFEDEEELWREILLLWNQITVEEVRSLYESLPRRINALYTANGGHTKY